MRSEIRRLHQTLGLTTVYVTHDQEEALALADRLVVLRDGLVQQVGSPEEVYAHPANRYVAGFMGYRDLPPVTMSTSDTVTGTECTLSGVDRDGFTEGDAVAAFRPTGFRAPGGGPPDGGAGRRVPLDACRDAEAPAGRRVVRGAVPAGAAFCLAGPSAASP